MAYEIEITDRAERAFKKLDKRTAQRFYTKLKTIANSEDPFQHVKRLTGVALFSIRVGDYRAILDIKRESLVILVVRVGHRSDVYVK
ncbi:MAG: type II toxin-antitoxin system RelE/ParE family toxin [Candidatus Micrarchaeota archaeon]|nr:type II toxin-antitoxin system RelE/ParE family toxin [Candidatus Micrarchaeota archaeon]